MALPHESAVRVHAVNDELPSGKDNLVSVPSVADLLRSRLPFRLAVKMSIMAEPEQIAVRPQGVNSAPSSAEHCLEFIPSALIEIEGPVPKRGTDWPCSLEVRIPRQIAILFDDVENRRRK